jgi:hypothetical protein
MSTRATVGELRAQVDDLVSRSRARDGSSAAPDPGRILTRAPRRDGTELRVSVHTYEGKPFVRVALWQSSAPDAWPVKGKGCSVRVGELLAVAAALLDAADAANDGEGR